MNLQIYLSIEIILSISDLLKPKDVLLEQIINDHTGRFKSSMKELSNHSILK